MKHSIIVFNIVYFLLLPSTPKITVAIQLAVGNLFKSFRHQNIFPQSTFVGTQVKRGKIIDDAIAYPIVEKINFASFIDLISEISAKRGQPIDDKCLFQQENVSSNGFFIR